MVGGLGCLSCLGELVGVLGWRGPEDRGCGGFLAFCCFGVEAVEDLPDRGGFAVAGLGVCFPLRELFVLGAACVPALALGVAGVRLTLRAAALDGDFAFVP